jgi:hypothetical protein
MIRNNKNNPKAISGTKKTPQNFDIYPSTSPEMFQWDAIR